MARAREMTSGVDVVTGQSVPEYVPHRSSTLGSEQASRVQVFPPEWFYPIPNATGAEQGADGQELKDTWVVRGVTRTVHFWARAWIC